MDLFGSYTGGLLGVLLFGCFVQVITILSLVRYGLGLSGFDIGIVTFILSLVLSLLLVEAKFGLTGSLEKTVDGKAIAFSTVIDSKIRPFLIENSDAAISQRVALVTQAISTSPTSADPAPSSSLAQLETVFLLSQLKRALSVGLILLIPLVLIDIMVAVTISVVGLQSISALALSIPLKLLLFVLIDGWNLIVNKLLLGFV